jgi:hypothetical protein
MIMSSHAIIKIQSQTFVVKNKQQSSKANIWLRWCCNIMWQIGWQTTTGVTQREVNQDDETATTHHFSHSSC